MSENKNEASTTESGSTVVPGAPNAPSVFAERMIRVQAEIDAKSEFAGNQLRSASVLDPEAFQEHLDQFVDEIALNSPDYQSAFERVQEARKVTVRTDTSAVEELKAIREQLKNLVISELGISSEALLNEMQKAHANIEDIIKKAEISLGAPLETPEDVLKALDIIESKEGARNSYSFPYDLVPPSVSQKWDTYIATVCKHTQAEDDLSLARNQGADRDQLAGYQDIVASTDRARKLAHDSVTTDLDAVLGIKKMGYEWEWAKTRELLANIRDQQFPTRASALSPAAREFVASHTGSIMVTEALTSKSHLWH